MTRRCGASSHGASVVAAPPSDARDSKTSVLAPDRARYAAETSPLWPPPMTMASYAFDIASPTFTPETAS